MLKPYTVYIDKEKDNQSTARTVYSAPTGMIFHNNMLAPSVGEVHTARTVSAQKQRPRSANASSRRDTKHTVNQTVPIPAAKNDTDIYGQISR